MVHEILDVVGCDGGGGEGPVPSAQHGGHREELALDVGERRGGEGEHAKDAAPQRPRERHEKGHVLLHEGLPSVRSTPR